MRRFATVVTGTLVLSASSWAGTGLVHAGSFDDALGVTGPGIVVERSKDDLAQDADHGCLATDTHDALVVGREIDAALLEEGLIHNEIEGPIGPDDPSVLGFVRAKPRVAAKPASLTIEASTAQAGAVSESDEPSPITDRVGDAEPIESSAGWTDKVKSAFSWWSKVIR